MTQDDIAQTELDAALDVARANSDQANFYYDAFLKAQLLMPVAREGVAGEWKQLGQTDRFQPLFLNYQQTKVVPLFDRMDRLRDWAGDRALDYIQLRCHVLVSLIAAEVGIVVNLATKWSYYFSPESLEQLRNAMKPVSAN